MGLLVTGGLGVDNSTELWATDQTLSCLLPALPKSMYDHTVSLVGERILSCFGDFCYQLTENGWEEATATVHFRHYHTAAVIPSGLLLVGGYRVGGNKHRADSDGWRA